MNLTINRGIPQLDSEDLAASPFLTEEERNFLRPGTQGPNATHISTSWGLWYTIYGWGQRLGMVDVFDDSHVEGSGQVLPYCYGQGGWLCNVSQKPSFWIFPVGLGPVSRRVRWYSFLC